MRVYPNSYRGVAAEVFRHRSQPPPLDVTATQARPRMVPTLDGLHVKVQRLSHPCGLSGKSASAVLSCKLEGASPSRVNASRAQHRPAPEALAIAPLPGGARPPQRQISVLVRRPRRAPPRMGRSHRGARTPRPLQAGFNPGDMPTLHHLGAAFTIAADADSTHSSCRPGFTATAQARIHW